MLIKYLGKSATVSKNGALYKFTPECEVEDTALIEELLKDPSFIKSEDEKAIRKGAEELLKPPEEKPEAGEFPCPYCPFISKSKIGLVSHIRHTHNEA